MSMRYAKQIMKAFGRALFQLLITIVLVGMVGGSLAFAENHIVLLPQSEIWLEGKSSLHPFESAATKIDATIELASAGEDSDEEAPISDLKSLVKKNAPLGKFEVTIPVKALKSGKDALDANLYTALKSKQFPNIVFRLLKYQTIQKKGEGAPNMRAAGRLTIAGKENAVEIVGTVTFVDQGISFVGKKEILMTDYGINPPTLMFGILKTENPVMVHFDLMIGEEEVMESGP